MRILLIALLCFLHMPAYASLFSPSSNSGTDVLNNSADFLPVDQAFKVHAI